MSDMEFEVLEITKSSVIDAAEWPFKQEPTTVVDYINGVKYEHPNMNHNYDYLIRICDSAFPGTVIQNELCDFLLKEKYTGSGLIKDIRKFIIKRKEESENDS